MKRWIATAMIATLGGIASCFPTYVTNAQGSTFQEEQGEVEALPVHDCRKVLMQPSWWDSETAFLRTWCHNIEPCMKQRARVVIHIENNRNTDADDQTQKMVGPWRWSNGQISEVDWYHTGPSIYPYISVVSARVKLAPRDTCGIVGFRAATRVAGDVPCSGVIVHRFYPGPVSCNVAGWQTLVDIYPVGTGKFEANTLCANAGGVRVVMTHLDNRKACWDRDF